MEAITITLNGREVSGQAGMTVFELAREAGIQIPHLCHDRHLAPIGACRICIVEDERNGALLASCVTPIASGMIINTDSARVRERRRILIELMLASHPDSCMVCDKGNRCQLRSIAAEYGVGFIDLEKIPLPTRMEDVNPFIERDLSKCILCAKCIRADQELVVVGALDYFNRGFSSRPSTFGDLPLEKSECTFCGVCVAACPTGALTEKEKSYHGSASRTVQTICPYCGCGCSISLEIKNETVVRSLPDEESEVNGGTLCVRGSYGYDFIHSPDRLTTPLVRSDGELQPATWEDALSHISETLNRIKQSAGPDSIGALASSRCTNEENYLLQRFARSVLQTNNIDHISRLHNTWTLPSLSRAIGSLGTTQSLQELELADMILVMGADPCCSAPNVAYAIKRAVKRKGAQLVGIDPRRTGLYPFARLWLSPSSNSDLVLLNSIAQTIIEESLINREFVLRRTDNYEELVQALQQYTPQYAQEVTGVPAEDIRRTARLYAGASQPAIIYGSGITRYPNGQDMVLALANIAILTGNTGPKGGGIYPLQKDCNGQGAFDMGALPDFLPGCHSISDKKAKKLFEQLWGTPLPAQAGSSADRMFEQAQHGTLKALLIMGENPLLSFPDRKSITSALSNLELLVVQDIFLSETAATAHVVLPAAAFAEKEGTFTNFEGRVRKLNKAIEPPGQSLPDWQIVMRLAEAMQHPFPFTSLDQIGAEIEQVVPVYEYSSFPTQTEPGESDILECRRTHAEQFLSGFPRFFPVSYNLPPLHSQNGYTFTLITGSSLFRFGSGSRSSRASRLKKHSPQALVQIHPDDAGTRGIARGDRVRIYSPAGEIPAVAELTDAIARDTLFVPYSYPDCPVYSLFELENGKTAGLFNVCMVDIERTQDNG